MAERQAWIAELREIQKTSTQGEPRSDFDEILADLRKDRWEE
jgi:hypothetical protein